MSPFMHQLAEPLLLPQRGYCLVTRYPNHHAPPPSLCEQLVSRIVENSFALAPATTSRRPLLLEHTHVDIMYYTNSMASALQINHSFKNGRVVI